MGLAFWICAVVTVVSAAVSCGYSVIGAQRSTGDARVPSLYALARSAALIIVAVIGLFSSSVAFVSAVAMAMIVVQAIDAVIGGRIHDRLKTVGPGVTAVANAAALVWMVAS